MHCPGGLSSGGDAAAHRAEHPSVFGGALPAENYAGGAVGPFFLSPSYLQKLFKRYTNQSPTDYLISLRIAKAKELIRTTQMSFSEIAFSVGIESYSYFIRLFKKQEGMTLKEYKTMWPGV